MNLDHVSCCTSSRLCLRPPICRSAVDQPHCLHRPQIGLKEKVQRITQRGSTDYTPDEQTSQRDRHLEPKEFPSLPSPASPTSTQVGRRKPAALLLDCSSTTHSDTTTSSFSPSLLLQSDRGWHVNGCLDHVCLLTEVDSILTRWSSHLLADFGGFLTKYTPRLHNPVTYKSDQPASIRYFTSCPRHAETWPPQTCPETDGNHIFCRPVRLFSRQSAAVFFLPPNIPCGPKSIFHHDSITIASTWNLDGPTSWKLVMTSSLQACMSLWQMPEHHHFLLTRSQIADGRASTTE